MAAARRPTRVSLVVIGDFCKVELKSSIESFTETQRVYCSNWQHIGGRAAEKRIITLTKR